MKLSHPLGPLPPSFAAPSYWKFEKIHVHVINIEEIVIQNNIEEIVTLPDKPLLLSQK